MIQDLYGDSVTVRIREISILRVSKVTKKKQTNAKKRHTLHAQYKELQGTMNMNQEQFSQ